MNTVIKKKYKKQKQNYSKVKRTSVEKWHLDQNAAGLGFLVTAVGRQSGDRGGNLHPTRGTLVVALAPIFQSSSLTYKRGGWTKKLVTTLSVLGKEIYKDFSSFELFKMGRSLEGEINVT